MLVLLSNLHATLNAAALPAAPPPFGLRLHHLASPVLGIESPHPVLSWKLDHPHRGATQAAYEIACGTAWNSGKVLSNETEGVALFVSPAWTYAPEHAYNVSVRWWSELDGVVSASPSPWSSTLVFVAAANLSSAQYLTSATAGCGGARPRRAELGSRIWGQNRFPPPEMNELALSFYLKRGVQIRYRFNQTPTTPF